MLAPGYISVIPTLRNSLSDWERYFANKHKKPTHSHHGGRAVREGAVGDSRLTCSGCHCRRGLGGDEGGGDIGQREGARRGRQTWLGREDGREDGRDAAGACGNQFVCEMTAAWTSDGLSTWGCVRTWSV